MLTLKKLRAAVEMHTSEYLTISLVAQRLVSGADVPGAVPD